MNIQTLQAPHKYHNVQPSNTLELGQIVADSAAETKGGDTGGVVVAHKPFLQEDPQACVGAQAELPHAIRHVFDIPANVL